jgi:hypothetical protein
MAKWLWKLVRLGKINQSQLYWALGRHYGYRTCCIKNFVNMDILGIYAIGFWMDEHIGMDKGAKEGLIRCVLCRK